MANSFVNKKVDLTTTSVTTLYTVPSATTAIIKSILVSEDSGNANDNCVSGFLHLFNPSSTTFVKHFISTIAEVGGGDSQLKHNLIAGYINTTSAIDEVQFKMSSGNIDAGDICLYGIK